MLQYLNSFLQNRIIQTKINHTNSTKIQIHDGIPQGSMLSPTLFNIALHDINKELDENIKLSVYADDITVWTGHSEVQIANANLLQAVNKIAAWTKRWALKISREKTVCCIFTTRHSFKKCGT
jgi:hypothetical protein